MESQEVSQPTITATLLEWTPKKYGQGFTAKAPLFGTIRVEHYPGSTDWEVNWSVPGYTDTFIPGGWQTAQEAVKATEDHIRAILASYN